MEDCPLPPCRHQKHHLGKLSLSDMCRWRLQAMMQAMSEPALQFFFLTLGQEYPVAHTFHKVQIKTNEQKRVLSERFLSRPVSDCCQRLAGQLWNEKTSDTTPHTSYFDNYYQALYDNWYSRRSVHYNWTLYIHTVNCNQEKNTRTQARTREREGKERDFERFFSNFSGGDIVTLLLP